MRSACWLVVLLIGCGHTTPAPTTPHPASSLPPFAYSSYSGGAFTLDVPSFFVTKPPPSNGKGQGWTWGDRASLSAAFQYADPSETLALFCEPGSVRISANSCQKTETVNGRIRWARTTLLAGQAVHFLGIEYEQSLSTAFAPIVEHVSASWKVYDGQLGP